MNKRLYLRQMIAINRYLKRLIQLQPYEAACPGIVTTSSEPVLRVKLGALPVRVRAEGYGKEPARQFGA